MLRLSASQKITKCSLCICILNFTYQSSAKQGLTAFCSLKAPYNIVDIFVVDVNTLLSPVYKHF